MATSEDPKAPDGPEPDSPAGPEPSGPERNREYRIAELAEEAGITVRTLRFYRERKLIPPPRREGRIAWYNDHHLARLRTIAALLERGHTLGGIAELLAAFDGGARDVAELLGVRPAPIPVPAWSEETPVRLTPEALADYFRGEATPENLAASLDLGYLAVDGDQLVHVSRRLLDVSRDLVDRGLPLAAVLEAARDLRRHVDAIAEVFATLLRTTVLAEPPSRIGETLEELRPMAKGVVDAELSMAMDRRIRAELAAWAGDPDRRRPTEP
ncbi:MerR family transcriptional regulator [Streptomyces sparsogenes]|uniref:MerR family transcriptional regulator n=1 Tax=Streptomyces sparsogenes DSM 40356 TaxID=1331668 RepID=A0A1R1SMZ5_9ACTN|nr:MerR family transcriptional regulator [Streptomyces sparsogenes]OMI39678.1 MerR family transcriptional regulator [Streptomyces sparsogenes DSM 40356]